jgi:hypothetical protein
MPGGISSSMSESPGMDSASTMLRCLRVIRRYSSIVSRTFTGSPRLVIKTGPFRAAFWAWLAFCWNSRLDSVVMDTGAPSVIVGSLEHNANSNAIKAAGAARAF